MLIIVSISHINCFSTVHVHSLIHILRRSITTATQWHHQQHLQPHHQVASMRSSSMLTVPNKQKRERKENPRNQRNRSNRNRNRNWNRKTWPIDHGAKGRRQNLRMAGATKLNFKLQKHRRISGQTDLRNICFPIEERKIEIDKQKKWKKGVSGQILWESKTSGATGRTEKNKVQKWFSELELKIKRQSN